MLVYRIEAACGKGPYGGRCNVNFSKHNTVENHPCYWCDGLTEWAIQNNGFTACGSIELLFSWFKDYIKQLIDCNAYITIYDTDHYMFGESGKQLVFRRESAKLEYRATLKEFIEELSAELAT